MDQGVVDEVVDLLYSPWSLVAKSTQKVLIEYSHIAFLNNYQVPLTSCQLLDDEPL